MAFQGLQQMDVKEIVEKQREKTLPKLSLQIFGNNNKKKDSFIFSGRSKNKRSIKRKKIPHKNNNFWGKLVYQEKESEGGNAGILFMYNALYSKKKNRIHDIFQCFLLSGFCSF